MILSDLLDVPVLDARGARIGYCIDARLVLDGAPGPLLAAARLHALIISPRTRTSFLGYERSSITAPWPLAPWLRRRHRGTFLLLWEDVERAGPHEITLRAGHRQFDPRL